MSGADRLFWESKHERRRELACAIAFLVAPTETESTSEPDNISAVLGVTEPIP